MILYNSKMCLPFWQMKLIFSVKQDRKRNTGIWSFPTSTKAQLAPGLVIPQTEKKQVNQRAFGAKWHRIVITSH